MSNNKIQALEPVSKPPSSFLRKQESSRFGLDPRFRGDDRGVSWVLKWVSVFVALIFGFSLVAEAKVPWQSNKLREKKKWEKIQAEIDAIPLMTEKAEGDYDILGPVSAQDALTNKRTYVYNKMRQIAYEMGADAVMEVRCKKILKWLAQSCDGFAIKYRNEEAEEPSSE